MALLHSTLLYISLPWVYFTLLYSTMALLHSYLLYIILPWLYFTLHYSTLLLITLPWLYFTLLDSRLLYRGSTLLYIILPWLYLTLQHEKRRAYDKRVREIDHGCFSPLVFSASGGMGPTAKVVYKKLASMIATKHNQCYSQTLNWLRCRLSFSLLRSAIMYLRGSRSSANSPAHPQLHQAAIDRALCDSRVAS